MITFDCYPDKLLGALQQMGPGRGFTYVVVLLRIYEIGGPCPEDVEDLAYRTGLSSDMVRKALDWLIERRKLYRTDDGGLMNRRAEMQLAQQKTKLIDIYDEIPRSQKSPMGEGLSAGGEESVSATEAGVGGNDFSVMPYRADSVKMDKPRKNRSVKSNRVSARAAAGKTGVSGKTDDWPKDAFQQFWDNVPRRIGRKAAERAFERARKSGVAWGRFFAGVERWKAESARKETQFICHPTTWLNQGRWDDDPEPNGGISGKTGQRAGRQSIWDRVNGKTMEQSSGTDIEIIPPGQPISGTIRH